MRHSVIPRSATVLIASVLLVVSCSQEQDIAREEDTRTETEGALSEVLTAAARADALRDAGRHFEEEYVGSPLHKAVIAVDLALVRQLVAEGVDVNEKDEYGARPLDWAAQNPKRKEIVGILLTAGADPCLHGMGGLTALHWAAMANQVEVVRTILREVDDPSMEDDHGITPLEYAQMLGHEEIAELLETKQKAGK